MLKNIELIQWYYNFLSLWKYLEQYMRNNDLSDINIDTKIKTWPTSTFWINKKAVNWLLKSIHWNSKKNIFWYLTELSARRGIFTATKEGIDNDQHFHNFIKETLKNQFFPFMQLLSLIRNILSHHMTSDWVLKQEDYHKQKEFLMQKEITRIHFKFKYSTYIKERKWSDEYWLDIKVNMKNLYDWIKIKKLFSTHQLYLLSELCYNLSEIYRVKHIKT